MAPSRARAARKQGRAAARAARKLKTKPAAQPSAASDDAAEALLATAKQCEATGRLHDAVAAYDRLLAVRPNNAAACEHAAALCMQLRRPDRAEALLRSAVAAQPTRGFEKFAYLSQLLGCCEEALALARRGIGILQAELAALDARRDAARAAELRAYEASAHCAVAEICLGIVEDSNDPAVAARRDPEVESAVAAALALCEEGSESEIEAMLALANLRLSQARREDAVESMKRVVLRMSEGLAALETGDNSDATVGHALGLLPALEIRIAVGKQLIEVEMWRAAISTLASVMWECDFNIEVWYLLAVANWKLGDIPEARAALENTRAVLRNPHGFEGQLEEEMIDKLYMQLGGQHGGEGDSAKEKMQE